MVSTRPPTSKSSSTFNNPFVIVSNAPITIGIIVTFMFHSFFKFPSKVEVLILLFTFLQFYSVISRDSKVNNFASSLFFLLITMRSGLLTEIRWSVCMLKSYRSLCVSFSRTDIGLCIYHLFVWTNFNFLHSSLWITLFSHSYLILHFFCANLLHSLIMWLIITSLSPHNLLIIIIVFHISVSRWSFTGLWVAVSFLKSLGLFSVFCPFSIMLLFGWIPLVRQLPSPPVPLVIL